MEPNAEQRAAAAPSQSPLPSSPVSKLRVAGAWSGVLEAPLDLWTLPMLRAEISRRSGGGRPPDCIKLISGGKVLKDGDGVGQQQLTLAQAGLRNNSKILASSVEPADVQFASEEKRLSRESLSEAERSQRLTRIRCAAEKMATRHLDGSLPFEDFNIELEDQDGNKVDMGSETDRRGVMMGLMLHASGKRLIRMKKYKDALDILTMGEEVFSLCNSEVIQLIDNVSILQIDMVWCYFLLQDISWLSMAGIRLANARKGFERSHGKDSSRFRLLQGGRHAELAIYLRLELLEGVVAYHNGQFEKSRKLLSSAEAKYSKLQVPDEALSLLMSMGYKERAAKRALRMTNQDITSAVEFLVEERAKRARKREEDAQRKVEIAELKTYGMTPLKKSVDILKLNQLELIGFERTLAAEALRVNENDTQKALDDLTNPEKNTNLQLRIEKRKQKQAADTGMLLSDGDDRSAGEALNMLAATAMEIGNAYGIAAASSNHSTADPTAEGSGLPPDVPAAKDEVAEERDTEMECEITKELHGDPLADYDIEVLLEGEAIAQYLAMLDSSLP